MSKVTSNKRKEEDDPSSVVYLGYIEDGDLIERELTKLTSDETSDANKHILPSSSSATGETSATRASNSSDQSIAPWLVNKIGGFPIFPYDSTTIAELQAALDSMRCKHCKSICVLIFQMNSAIDDSPSDRVLQVYTCINSTCIRHSWFTMRCMLKPQPSNPDEKPPNPNEILGSTKLEYVLDESFGAVLVCREHAFFKPYYVSVLEEPTGRENFAKNNLEALKLAAKFDNPDLKPASIEAKYKNLKNYKPPQPPANLSDLEDFEKFQMEKLYGNDKDMYRFYKRISRYQAQIVRYDWEGQPLVNSSKVKFDILPCNSCKSQRKFEFQLMSALINYFVATEGEFDRESIDFSSIIAHCCSKNCSVKTFNIEDTYFMPDPDSRIFNKVKQKMLEMKLGKKDGDIESNVNDLNLDACKVGESDKTTSAKSSQAPKTTSKKKKKKKK